MGRSSRKDIEFAILRRDPSGARRTRFVTAHGAVECPAFMPVGTQGAVKALTPTQVEDTGARVVLANTFHLALENRDELVRRAGGIHRFMGWKRAVLTDSGGFQVFSLPRKTITDDGVRFAYPAENGADLWLDPETSMDVQRKLGADIVMAFDECAPHDAPVKRVRAAVERTFLWARRCREAALQDHQLLFGIVQGGVHDDLRARSAAQMISLPFDGYAIGGVSVGEGHETMVRVVRRTAALLPEARPRYVMGVGTPEDILAAVKAGADMFDCVIPTRYARGGTLFTRTGRIRVGDKKYRKDRYPPDTACRCYTCRTFSRMYLRHLHYAGEPLFQTLASLHNLTFYQDLMREIREAIEDQTFDDFARAWLDAYGSHQRKKKRSP